MDEIRITGGRPLKGEITVQGSKNAALPMMAAALLSEDVCVLRGCPRITDVACMEEILRSLGARTWWEGNNLCLDCAKADGTVIPGIHSGQMRSSVILMGAALARNGRCSIGYPGGCVIGRRPVDLHIQALRSLGAKVEESPLRITASCAGFKGTTFRFARKSVGASEQGILAAVLAQGDTVFENCSAEPEIFWLCCFLKKMGAQIFGAGGERIFIRGVKNLKGADMRVPSDRIVAGTYLFAAAATRGCIVLADPPWAEMHAFLDVYEKMGGQYDCIGGKLIADARGIRQSLPFLSTASYPGFPTDLQSPVMAAFATVPGTARIRETVFENRFRAAGELKKLGADIEICGQEAIIRGGRRLTGTRVSAPELRGGAALVIAALAAQGETTVEGYRLIRRGYEDICRDVAALGGQIEEDTGT